MNSQTHVIVGASLAGAKAAEELREQGFDGTVVLIGEEAERPYERPPLSKDYLRAEAVREKLYVHPAEFYREHDIELRSGTRVERVDAGASTVHLEGGETIAYDRLLLATGAEPRRLEVPGAELDGIHYLRSVDDCDVLRRRLDAGGKVAVVGSGWIGAEFAASARQRGLEVTVIDPVSVPLERVLGRVLGGFYRDIHESHGVDFRLGTGVERLEGDGAVQRVITGDGERVECDFVVVGVGVTPRTKLAADAGLDLDNGVLVNERLQTSDAKVFGAGDVANATHPFYGRRIRVEHWSNALNQGPAAARAMLDQDVAYDRLPYFFSDQYDVGMEYSGYATDWDEIVFRGDPQSREFVSFWLKDGHVLAGMNVNVWDVNEHVQTLIRSRQPVDRRALADTDTPLDSLVGARDG